MPIPAFLGESVDSWSLLGDGAEAPVNVISYQTDANHSYTDPALTQNQWFTVVKPTASGDYTSETKYHDGTAIRTVTTDSSVPTKFYDKTAPGTSDVISDEDQYAIMTADGEYTMVAQTAGRRIHLAKSGAGAVTVRGTGAGNLAEWASDQGMSADQILTINRQLEFATAVGSAAGPWSIFEGVTDGTGSGAYRVQGSIHIMEYDNGFVRQWGRTTGATSTFVVPYKDAAALDAQVTVNNSSVRYVHIAAISATRIDFVREGGTGAEVMWSVFGEKA